MPASSHELIILELKQILSKSPYRLDATNRRGRIVISAAIVIYTQGFLKLSTASIAKQAGVSTATLYRLYPTNWDLFQAAYGLGVNIYMAWLERDIQAANPLVQFTHYASIYFETFFDVQSKKMLGSWTSYVVDHRKLSKCSVIAKLKSNSKAWSGKSAFPSFTQKVT